jgi:L-malate glycosyltransferase
VDVSTPLSEIKLNKPIQIIFAGRFMPQKNPLVIVGVLAALKDLNWRCAMLGNGPLLQDVKHEIEKHGMSGRFDLPGWVTPQEVLNWFSKSDILFMPSLSEGLPVVGVQALASGLALVVSDIGGFMDLVDQDQNGFLVPMQDYAGFEFALRKLISTPDLLIHYRKTSLIKSNQFSLDQVALKYNSIFEGLLK